MGLKKKVPSPLLKKKTSRRLMYLLPVFITAAALLIVMAIKGVYPFGENTLFKYDMEFGDFPGLVYLNDIVHGRASLFYDWFTGVGTERNMLPSLLDPANFLMALLPRSFLLKGISFWILIKFMMIAFCAILFFHKTFTKLPYYWQLVFSLIYTMNGYTLRYYQNTGFLLYVAVFPIVVLGVLRLFQKNKYGLYIASLAYVLFTSAYFSWFFILFLILIGGLYLYSFYEKERRGKLCFRFGMATFCALLLSAGSLIPSLIELFGGYRFGSDKVQGSANLTAQASSGILSKIKAIYFAGDVSDINKVLLLVCMEFAAAALFFLLLKFKKDKRHITFFLASSVLMLLPVEFENINLIWHGGSYSYYSMRYGFMIIFMLCCAAAYYYDIFDPQRDRPEKKKVYGYLKLSAAVLWSAVTCAWVGVSFGNLRDYDAIVSVGPMLSKAYSYSCIRAFAVIFVLLILLNTFSSKKIRRASVIAVIMLLLGANIFFFFALKPCTSLKKTAYAGSSLQLAPRVKNEDLMSRKSVPDGSLFCNYPYLTEWPSIGGWTHSIDAKTKKSMVDFGYSSEYTVLLDSGGTPFTNSLFHVTDTVSKSSMNKLIYQKKQNLGDGFTRYSFKSNLPFGLLFNDSVLSLPYSENTFEYQNKVASSLIKTASAAGLYEKAVPTSIKKYVLEEKVPADSGSPLKLKAAKGALSRKYTEYHFNLKKNQVLYFCYNDENAIANDSLIQNMASILLNGKELKLPAVFDQGNRYYPYVYNNNVIELGSFDGEVTVTFKLNVSESRVNYDKFTFYTLDASNYASLCSSAVSPVTNYKASGRTLTMQTSGDRNGNLFIPLRYSSHWKCTVDGKKAEIQKVLGSFMCISLQSGTHEIVFKYDAFDGKLAIGGFLAAFMLIMVGFYIVYRRRIEPSRWCYRFFRYAFAAVFIAVLTAVYVLPLICQIIMLF